MWFRMRTGAQSTSIHFKPPLEVDCAEVDSIHFECALAPMRIGCEISQCALNAHSMRIGFQCEKALKVNVVAVKLGVVGLTAMDVLLRAISHFMYCTRNMCTGSCAP